MVNYRKLFLQSVLISWGKIPHPRASIPVLESSIRNHLIVISGGLNLDPEVPDGLLSVLLPALKTRGVKAAELGSVATSLNKLGDPGTGAVGGTLDETAKTLENEGLLDNVGDIVGGILALDIGETVFEIGDLFGDLLSGGGF